MEASRTRALITGASGGIGHALAARLCAEGAHLLLVARRVALPEALARQYPGQVSVVSADLGSREGRERVLAAARAFGGLNCVVNAAGINQFALLEDQDDAALESLVAINLTAMMQLTRLLLPLLRQAPDALLVNVGSTFGSIGFPGFAAYCASKFAVRGFSEALRRELADSRVKVLYIAPRATRTDMNAAPVVAMNVALKVAMDAPDTVAAQIAGALRREREELYLGWPEKLFARLNGLLPRLVDQALRKQLPVVKRFAGTASLPGAPTGSGT